MNKNLYRDVREVLHLFEDMPYEEIEYCLETALRVIRKHCFLNLEDFDGSSLMEDEENGI